MVSQAANDLDPAGEMSPPVASREVARRVVEAMLIDVQRDPDDEIDRALAAIGRALPSAVVHLATCPDINTIELFVKERTRRVIDRNGRYICQEEAEKELALIKVSLQRKLARRYTHILRKKLHLIIS